MKPELAPARPAVPKLVLADWWTDTATTLGPVLGGKGATGVAESLEAFATLEEEEQRGYVAVLAYRQLHATAELHLAVRALDQRLARLGGVTREKLDEIAGLLAEPAEDEIAEDEDGEVDDEEAEELRAEAAERARREAAERQKDAVVPATPRRRRGPRKATEETPLPESAGEGGTP